jgi:hypothetical protein
MRKFVLRRPSPALVVAFVALLIALGGTSLAAFRLPRDSVGSKQLKHNAVTAGKIKNGAVTASKINTRGLTVPDALHANSADSAAHATNATHATSATNATTADTATDARHATTADSATNATTATTAINADLLGGLPGTLYQRRNAEGSALAGALITSTGGVTSWFNAFGGAPTVTHAATTGVYDISFQGLDVQGDNTVILVTPNTPSADCTATNASNASNASTTFIVVETRDCDGDVEDRGFHVIAFGDSASG